MNNHLTKNQTIKMIEQLITDRMVYKEGNKLIGLALHESAYEKLKLESSKWSKPYI